MLWGATGVGKSEAVRQLAGELDAELRDIRLCQKQPTDIGKELAVNYIVSGAIRRRDNSVEAELRMTETESGRIVWSEIFDAPNDNQRVAGWIRRFLLG